MISVNEYFEATVKSLGYETANGKFLIYAEKPSTFSFTNVEKKYNLSRSLREQTT